MKCIYCEAGDPCKRGRHYGFNSGKTHECEYFTALFDSLRKILTEGTREHWTDEGKLEKTYSPEAKIAKLALEGK